MMAVKRKAWSNWSPFWVSSDTNKQWSIVLQRILWVQHCKSDSGVHFAPQMGPNWRVFLFNAMAYRYGTADKVVKGDLISHITKEEDRLNCLAHVVVSKNFQI